MLLSHLGKYSCEYESLKFAMNAPKCFDLIVNIMFSVVLKPLLIKILRIIRTLYQQHQWLTDAYYESDGELPSSQHSLTFRKRFVLLLWQSGECSCEDEYLNFVLNSSKMAVGLTPTTINACHCLYERCQRLRTLYQPYQFDGEWPSSQHPLQFRNRFLNSTIFVNEVGIKMWTFQICYQRLRRHGECCEKFERVSNISFP